MDKNYEEGEEEIISESESEYEESAFSDDDIIGWEDDGDSSDDEQIDFDKSMYEIATLPVEDAPDLTNIDAPWISVTEPEKGDFNVDFDSSISGTKHIYDNCKVPRDFFDLMFTPRLWDMLVQNTNKYGRNLNKWKDVRVKTMYGFMAMVFNMGLIRKNRLHDYWSTSLSMDTPWFRMMISRDYFKQILRAFHVVDNDTIPAKNDPTYRPSMRIRPLLDYLDVICTIITPIKQFLLMKAWLLERHTIQLDNIFPTNTTRDSVPKYGFLLIVSLLTY